MTGKNDNEATATPRRIRLPSSQVVLLGKRIHRPLDPSSLTPEELDFLGMRKDTGD